MEYKRYNNKLILRIERGEEVMESIERLCQKEGIRLGSISGLGAADFIKVGLYNIHKKEYHQKTFEGEFEITNITGNISQMNNSLYLHLHITFSNDELRAFGGHLNELRISATAEIVIDIIDGESNRFNDDETGLNLLCWNK